MCLRGGSGSIPAVSLNQQSCPPVRNGVHHPSLVDDVGRKKADLEFVDDEAHDEVMRQTELKHAQAELSKLVMTEVEAVACSALVDMAEGIIVFQ